VGINKKAGLYLYNPAFSISVQYDSVLSQDQGQEKLDLFGFVIEREEFGSLVGRRVVALPSAHHPHPWLTKRRAFGVFWQDEVSGVRSTAKGRNQANSRKNATS